MTLYSVYHKTEDIGELDEFLGEFTKFQYASDFAKMMADKYYPHDKNSVVIRFY